MNGHSIKEQLAKRSGSTGAAASVVFFGNLAWLGWVWAVILVLMPIALLIIDAAGGSLDESLWGGGGGLGWQRWVLFTCGVFTTTMFLRTVVTRGVTRRSLARGSILAMVTLSVIGSVVAAVGFVIERPFFVSNDWGHRLRGVGVIEWGELPRLAVEHGLLMAVYYLSGWLIGAAFVRSGVVWGMASIIPSLLPSAIIELTVSRGTGGFEIGALPSVIADPAFALSLSVAAVVIVATAVLASRITRSLPVR